MLGLEGPVNTPPAVEFAVQFVARPCSLRGDESSAGEMRCLICASDSPVNSVRSGGTTMAFASAAKATRPARRDRRNMLTFALDANHEDQSRSDCQRYAPPSSLAYIPFISRLKKGRRRRARRRKHRKSCDRKKPRRILGHAGAAKRWPRRHLVLLRLLHPGLCTQAHRRSGHMVRFKVRADTADLFRAFRLTDVRESCRIAGCSLSSSRARRTAIPFSRPRALIASIYGRP